MTMADVSKCMKKISYRGWFILPGVTVVRNNVSICIIHAWPQWSTCCFPSDLPPLIIRSVCVTWHGGKIPRNYNMKRTLRFLGACVDKIWLFEWSINKVFKCNQCSLLTHVSESVWRFGWIESYGEQPYEDERLGSCSSHIQSTSAEPDIADHFDFR